MVWAENLATTPACGGANPPPCAESTEPGGRRSRVVLARLDYAEPVAPQSVSAEPMPKWGSAFRRGDALPIVPHLSAGVYTAPGAEAGSARVEITENPARTMIMRIAVTYSGYRDGDGITVDGTESVERRAESGFAPITWHSDLSVSGTHTGTRRTSEPGGLTLGTEVIRNDFQAAGTLTTVLDGHTYTQPGNGS
ncbi:hypothetical protein [Nocardia jiangsuensis]|uniref:Uncharacterized protein n=1 Tax=Nocardia jiangsuensis TaxID=1691563 RepID=A0ABV8DQL0_9NOCA